MRIEGEKGCSSKNLYFSWALDLLCGFCWMNRLILCWAGKRNQKRNQKNKIKKKKQKKRKKNYEKSSNRLIRKLSQNGHRQDIVSFG